MQSRKLKLKPWIFFPLTLILVAIATLIFVLIFKDGEGLAAKKKPAEVSAAPVETPEPVVIQAKRLFAYKDNGYWGYKSETGEIKIPATYAKAQEFSEGFAWVADGTGKYGLISETGDVVYPFQYDDARAFRENYAAVKQGEFWGYANNSGAIQILPQYDGAWDFSAGYARVSQEGKVNYIDAAGNPSSGESYDKGQDFANTDLGPLAIVGLKDAESKVNYYLAKPDGTQIGALGKIEGILPYVENVTVVRLESGLYTYYDTAGRDRIMDTFEEAQNFSEGFAAVKKDGQWGFIRNESDVVYAVTPQYKEAQAFSEGYAAVRDENGWFYIDTMGQVIGNPSDRFDKAEAFSLGFTRILIANVYYIMDVSGNKVELYTIDPADLLASFSAEVKTGGGALNVRKEPDADAERIMQVPNGSKVLVLETVGDWYKIEYENSTGYATSSYVFKIEEEAGADIPAGTEEGVPEDTAGAAEANSEGENTGENNSLNSD